MKNERGMTLVELLAVIVIIGIVLAIAIPSISTIIKHSKADTHLANAKQVLHAGKIAHISGLEPDFEGYVAPAYSLKFLIAEGLLEGDIQNPSIFPWENVKNVYDEENSLVVVNASSDSIEYQVNLSLGGSNYIFNNPQPLHAISRDKFTEDLKKQFNIQ